MNICSRDRELLCINFKFLIFMVIPVLLVVASLVVLYFGADFLVKGSSSLAVRFGISPLVVGLTVVAFGTSAPGCWSACSPRWKVIRGLPWGT